jgi:hypothetical protein
LIDYPLPLVDEDLKNESGIPENAMKLGRLIAGSRRCFPVLPRIQFINTATAEEHDRLGQLDFP